MSENYDDKDIEKLIFKGGLSSGAIEPSEKFWNKAYENILERDSRSNKTSASKWRAAFFGMGIVAMLIAMYAFYMNTEVSEIKQQLTTIESTQKTIIQQNTAQTAVTASAEKTISTKGSNSINNANTVALSVTEPEKVNVSSAPATNFKNKSTPQQGTTTIASIAPSYSPTASDRNSIATETSQASNTIAKNSDNSLNPVAANGNTTKTTEQVAANTNMPPAAIKTVALSPTPSPIVSATTASKNTPLNNSVAKTADLDSSNALSLDRKPFSLKNFISKLSVSAFYAPGETDDFLHDKNNAPNNSITAQDLKTQQDGDGTFATGIRLAYDISDKWSIATGCYYSLYSYNINPTVIYAQQQENGEIGYSITTTSGTVFIPYSAGTAHVGDSIKVKGSSSRGYLSIPLQAKYKFPISTKLDFYLTGGFAVNIANYKETEINWENTAFQEGNVSVQNIYGLEMVQYTYNFGFGAEYLIKRGLSIYAEPYLDGSFTSINNNTPVSTYPYFFGIALGITYHF